ncbi:MAG: hypothetical protein J7621_05045 [Niastella sp.]|nr:hypothetical protein [Niastella sp.]
MTFPIEIRHDGQSLRLVVEQVFLDKQVERYKVLAKNGHIILESNRPMLRNRGLKSKPPIWKAVESHNLSAYVLDKIYEAIMKQVDK